MKGHQKKYNIQSVIKTLLGRECEVEKKTKLLKETVMFEEIQIRVADKSPITNCNFFCNKKVILLHPMTYENYV